MFSLITIFFMFQLFFAVLLLFGTKKIKKDKKLDNFEDLSIIIPFKNELDRIDDLIQSINQSAIENKNNDLFNHLDFIFVDDHSNDLTSQKLINNLDVKFRLYKLNNTSGKKYAIKQGVDMAISNKILTLDADVQFDINYLNYISKTKCDGLTILPVKMTGKNLMQNLFSIEFEFLQILTFGLAGFKKYSLCNGANLLFLKSTFKQSLDIRTDENILGGDDIYLLKACQKLKIPINAIGESNFAVKTNAPKNINELLHQRLRWIKKMNDLPSFLGGCFILVSNLLFVLSIIFTFGSFWWLLPIFIKLISELIVIQNNNLKIKVIAHQIWYPVYLILLLINLPKKIIWK